MIPLKDNTKSESFPIITIIIILLNVAVFFFQNALPYQSGIRFIYEYGLVPQYLMNQPFSAQGWFTIFSSSFLHEGLAHLIGNMWILWLFGDNVEDKMGRGRFILFYLLATLVAGICECVSDPISTIPVIGASGAVAGVMGAYFMMFRQARILTYVFPIFLFAVPAWIYLGIWALVQTYLALAETISGSVGDIALWAHVGGFLAGMLLYRFLMKPIEPGSEEFYRS